MPRREMPTAVEERVDGTPDGTYLISSSKHVTLWRSVGDDPWSPANPDGEKVFEPSSVSREQRNYYTEKVDESGKRVFYLESELPAGWRSVYDVRVPRYSCPIGDKTFPEWSRDANGRKIHGLLKLREHLHYRHAREYQLIWKEQLEGLIKKELGELPALGSSTGNPFVLAGPAGDAE